MPQFLVTFKGGPWDGMTVDRGLVQLRDLRFTECSSTFWVQSPGVIIDKAAKDSEKDYAQHGYSLIDRADFGSEVVLRCRYFGSR